MKPTLLVLAVLASMAAPALADETGATLAVPSTASLLNPAPQDGAFGGDLRPHRTSPDDYYGQSSFSLGVKNLDRKDWGDIDRQYAMAVLNDFRLREWPFSIALDLRFSFGAESDSEGGLSADLSGHTLEFNLGARWVVETGRFRPYAGAGLSLVSAKQTVDFDLGFLSGSASASGFGAGAWANAGFYFDMHRGFILGLDLCYSSAQVDLDGADLDAGGLAVTMSIGGSF